MWRARGWYPRARPHGAHLGAYVPTCAPCGAARGIAASPHSVRTHPQAIAPVAVWSASRRRLALFLALCRANFCRNFFFFSLPPSLFFSVFCLVDDLSSKQVQAEMPDGRGEHQRMLSFPSPVCPCGWRDREAQASYSCHTAYYRPAPLPLPYGRCCDSCQVFSIWCLSATPGDVLVTIRSVSSLACSGHPNFLCEFPRCVCRSGPPARGADACCCQSRIRPGAIVGCAVGRCGSAPSPRRPRVFPLPAPPAQVAASLSAGPRNLAQLVCVRAPWGSCPRGAAAAAAVAPCV